MNECKVMNTGDAALPALLAGLDAEVARAGRPTQCRVEGQPTYREFELLYRGKYAALIFLSCI
jgi:hypothetical protein